MSVCVNSLTISHFCRRFFRKSAVPLKDINFTVVMAITRRGAKINPDFSCVDRRKCVIYHLFVRYYRKIAVAEEDQPCVRT